MNIGSSQIFNMEETVLHYDIGKGILMCKWSGDKIIWAKKLKDVNNITNIIEDKKNYYVACEENEVTGQFLALMKENGSSLWYIPGRSYFQQIFQGHLYLIFINDKNKYFFIKVDCHMGEKIWYHKIDPDLYEYSFKQDRILLNYSSGKAEKISTETGFLIG